MNQYLSLLNPAQAQGIPISASTKFSFQVLFIAVEHRPDVPLQILAGPGSGKTKVGESVTVRVFALTNSRF